MSKEVFQLVGEMDREDLQTQLALQCAPLLMGIKMSNLLIVPNRNVLDVYELFKDTCISVELIYMSEQKTMFLLYRREELDIYLESATTKEVMELFGYRGMTPVEIRRELIHRYEKYAEGNGMFPHEMGVLLGYPTEDVLGFIENQGKNYLYAGYWKVYGNLMETKALFEEYNKAKEHVITMVSQGIEIRRIFK